MIRRYPLRPARRPFQDFHFFAASDRPLSPEVPGAPPAIPQNPASAGPPPQESAPPDYDALPATPKTPPNPSPRPVPTPQPEPEPEPEPVTVAALARAMDYLASVDGPSIAAPQKRQSDSAEPHPRRRRTPARAGSQRRERSSRSGARRRKSAARKSRTSPQLAVPRRSAERGGAGARPDGSHHERHCTVCTHPDRAAIETEFMHWHAPGHIAYDYKISRSAVFRHAHAVGLFARRNRNLRFALGHLIERVQDVEPTADCIVRAIHAFARVNDEGDWIEPPSHLIVSSGSMQRSVSGSHRPVALPVDAGRLSGFIDVTPDPALPSAPVLHDLPEAEDSAPASVPGEARLPGTVDRVETDATR